MKIERHAANIHTLKIDSYAIDLLCISDVHFDSVGCDRALLKQHLDEAKKDGCQILIIGDWFDLMQGRYDPRRSNQGRGMRQEYAESEKEYLDAVMEDSVNFLAPYVDNILIIALGNHETSCMKNSGTNMAQRLVTMLNYKYPNQECPIQCSGYTGWLKIHSSIENSHIRTFLIKYRHGDRGNAQRSKGVLQVDIDAMRWPSADIIIKGDDHMKWLYPSVVRKELNSQMQLIETTQYQVRLGSYVDGLEDEMGGFAVERGFGATKRGGWRMELSHSGKNQRYKKVKIYEA